MMWRIRWHIARFLVHLGLHIAPRGPARDLFVSALERESAAILRALRAQFIGGQR